jgi:hypothetical protein
MHAAVQVQYLSFDEQISCFEIVKKAMIAKIGKDAAEAAANAALFQIGLGEGGHVHGFFMHLTMHCTY